MGFPENDDTGMGFPENDDTGVGFPENDDTGMGFPENEMAAGPRLEFEFQGTKMLGVLSTPMFGEYVPVTNHNITTV